MPEQKSFLEPPAKPVSKAAKKKRKTKAVKKGRLRVHDPFELIRWLALSQPDPRKALAELVQNSLDAGAENVRVTRMRLKGVPCLRIWDDGEGVIPELERPQALEYIATHIGHSRKRSLTPQQRLELMTQGQYGIGLLGFWSLGEMLEVRSSLPGHKPYRLILHRERPSYTVEPLRGRLPFHERWTEVIVVGLHRGAMPALVARRAADYLAAELRGQLRARGVDLVVHDRMARGKAPKLVPVHPRRYLGEGLAGLGPIEVPGHPALHLEIYFVGSSRDRRAADPISVYAAGTLVAESFHDLGALGLDRLPWTDERLTGFVDFPGLTVTPGSRRGIVPDSAASAFAQALSGVEPQLEVILGEHDRRRAEDLDRTLLRDLRRAFRDFYRNRPRYALLPVEATKQRDGGGNGSGVDAPEGVAIDSLESEPQEAAEADVHMDGVSQPGTLASVQLRPARVRLECAGRRLVQARAVDAAGRKVVSPVEYRWGLSGEVGSLRADPLHPDRIELRGAPRPAQGRLTVHVRSGDVEAQAEAKVEVLEELLGGSSDEGIPDPELVDEPESFWRSRLRGERWQVNSGHPEYLEIIDRPALKLRYLAMLFAKEVVLKSSQDPRFEAPLEQLVEIAGYADRKLSLKRARKRKAK